jgi:peptide/nickel transport system substrate-binding protein
MQRQCRTPGRASAGTRGGHVVTRRQVLRHGLAAGLGLGAAARPPHPGWSPVPQAWAAPGEPAGEVRWAVHVTLAPSWFDPGEAPAAAIPYLLLYLVHDALVRPMPDQPLAPSLAERWTASPDGLTYEFTLRPGLTFHNGDPCTAEDAQFSFQRYRGAAAKTLHEKVHAVEVVDAHRLRFVLTEPWPDFLTTYGTAASGAAWIVPKTYLTQVGDDQFRQHPIGLGPYKIVRHTPGVEIVAEASAASWRKAPHVKRLVLTSGPDETTRLAMLKRGEADIAYALQGPIAEAVQNTPPLRLVPVVLSAMWCLDFPEQGDPTSPWYDQRVRLAASLAIDRTEVNASESLGYARLTGSVVPPEFPFALEIPPHPYDPERAKQLLTEAGYPQGVDAGALTPLPNAFSLGETVGNYLRAVGIRTTLHTMERAAFLARRREHTLQGLILDGLGGWGNAATVLEMIAARRGTRVSGGYPDLDDLFRQQEQESDRAQRQAILHDIQRRMHERVVVAPLFQIAMLVGVNHRVVEPALGRIPLHPYSAPYEDVVVAG